MTTERGDSHHIEMCPWSQESVICMNPANLWLWVRIMAIGMNNRDGTNTGDGYE